MDKSSKMINCTIPFFCSSAFKPAWIGGRPAKLQIKAILPQPREEGAVALQSAGPGISDRVFGLQ